MAIRLVSKTSLRLCDSLRISTAQLRFYSTQPTDHVASKDIATSDGASRDKDDHERRNAYRRQYMARKRADPEFRAQEQQYNKDHYARNPAKKVQKTKSGALIKLRLIQSGLWRIVRSTCRITSILKLMRPRKIVKGSINERGEPRTPHRN